MRYLMLAIVGGVLFGSITTTTQSADAAGKQAAEKTILANEQVLYDAIAKADKRFFQLLVDPDGVWTTSTGFVQNGQLVDALATYHVTKWHIENPRLSWLEENSVIVRYTVMVEGRWGDIHPLPPIALASTVWIRRNGAWRAVHHQESELMQ